MNDLDQAPLDETDGYERVNQKVWLKRDSQPIFTQVDAVILDIDGVVIDVSSSFRVAISQTAQLYLTRQAGLKGDDVLLTPSETQLFKLAGGFNNDWDLTAAAILFYLAKAEILESQNTQVLRRDGQMLRDFAAAAGLAGGGTHGAMAVLFPMLSKKQRENVESLYDRGKIETLFQELYGGVDYCQRLYGHKPVFNQRKGLVNEEKIMLDNEVLSPFLPNAGVLTGRTGEEARLALEMSGLDAIIPRENVVFDAGSDPNLRKPHPDELLRLAGSMGAKVALYVGDVMDDLLVVKNANRDPAAPCVFVSALITASLARDNAALFRREGADIVSLDVNEAIRTVTNRRQG